MRPPDVPAADPADAALPGVVPARLALTAVLLALCNGCGGGGSGTPTGPGASGDPAGSAAAADRAGQLLSSGRCTGTDKPPLTWLPMAAEDVAFIEPYGLMVGGHVTPVDHQYFSPIVFDSAPGTYPVYAAADSTLHEITTRTHHGQGSYTGQTITDHRLVFSLSCRLLYYYDLVTDLSPGLTEQLAASNGALQVRAGQPIGRIGNQTLDFAVWDTERPLSGFIVPEHYEREAWKRFTADPLDHYDAATRAMALARYLRIAPPVSGRIDYDQDGRLIGNWFQAHADGSTNGYAGDGGPEYWVTHLAFAPHFLDPTVFIVSIGQWPGPEGASQFVALEGGPDPARVEVSTGLVRYTLAPFEMRADAQRWNGMSRPMSSIAVVPTAQLKGCLLAQMLEARAIRAESFPGIPCSAVDGFTPAAARYVR